MTTKIPKYIEDIEQNIQGLLHGQVVCIDPSVGSYSSLPGWSVYRKQLPIASGVFDMPLAKSLPDRLRALHNYVRKLYIEYPPDVLVYEDIPAQRHGGGNANSHASLLKSVGAILAVPGPDGHVGIMPVSWKPRVRPGYIKSDEGDALEIGWIVIDVARQLESGEMRGSKITRKGKKNA